MHRRAQRIHIVGEFFIKKEKIWGMSRYLTFVKQIRKKIPKNGLRLHLKVALFESLSRAIF